MRLEAVAIVKNEADIIESFVRHHVALLDRLHLLDNGSTDGTREILAALAGDLSGLSVTDEQGADHPQAGVLSRFLASRTDPPDWMFCLDADEFIETGDGAELGEIMAALDGRYCHLVRWELMVPTENDDPAVLDPARRIRHRRAVPVPQWLSKVVVPASQLGVPGVQLMAGNHGLRGPDGSTTPHLPARDLRLAHFPVRSFDQFAKKVVVGDWAISSRLSRQRGEGRHWRDHRRRVLAGELLKPGELTEIALHYGSDDDSAEQALLDRPLRGPQYRLEHTPDAERPFGLDALAFADRHFSRLRSTALRNGGVVVTKTPYGLIAHRQGSDECSRGLERYGEWAGFELDYLVDQAPRGGRVIEIGAGIGLRCVALAAAVGPEGEVIAVESDADPYRLLLTNLVLNDVDNVTPERELGLIATLGVERLDLLVVDRPDAAGVLAEVAPVLDRLRPRIFVAPGATTSDCVRALTGRGYSCWWHLEPKFNPENFAGDPMNVLDGPPFVHVLALPPGSPEPDLTAVQGPLDTWERAWSDQGCAPRRTKVDWWAPVAAPPSWLRRPRTT